MLGVLNQAARVALASPTASAPPNGACARSGHAAVTLAAVATALALLITAAA
ncbi:hypothetical protein [Streptomyces echinatus]|uniref:hypothetical protein n=1 Tax=Streptomyces echinatus TaxID=67293 RepID=UPI0031E8B9F0